VSLDGPHWRVKLAGERPSPKGRFLTNRVAAQGPSETAERVATTGQNRNQSLVFQSGLHRHQAGTSALSNSRSTKAWDSARGRGGPATMGLRIRSAHRVVGALAGGAAVVRGRSCLLGHQSAQLRPPRRPKVVIASPVSAVLAVFSPSFLTRSWIDTGCGGLDILQDVPLNFPRANRLLSMPTAAHSTVRHFDSYGGGA
jgi:hypothetical protein